jgi:hypothetical protein
VATTSLQEKKFELYSLEDDHGHEDCMAVELWFRKNYGLTKAIFEAFGGLRSANKEIETFDDEDRMNRICKNELWVFIKEFGFSDPVDFPAVQQNAVFDMCAALLGEEESVRGGGVIKCLDFELWEKFIMQFSVLAYSSSSYKPPSFHLDNFKSKIVQMTNLTNDQYRLGKFLTAKSMVSHFKVAGLKGEDLKNGYEKLTVETIEYKSIFPKGLDIDPAWQECYSIITDLLNSTFKIDSLQPVPIKSEKIIIKKPLWVEHSYNNRATSPTGAKMRRIVAPDEQDDLIADVGHVLEQSVDKVIEQ